MLLELKFSIGTLGLATGTLISAFYGMNLKNFIEESDLGFLGVSGACLIASGIVCAYALSKLRKVQRVRMWGEGGSGVAAAAAAAKKKRLAAAANMTGAGSSSGSGGSRGNWRSEASAEQAAAMASTQAKARAAIMARTLGTENVTGWRKGVMGEKE